MGISLIYNTSMNNNDIDSCISIIRKNSSELVPLQTGLAFSNNIKSSIRAYIFDVYGTLFISGSGDIGLSKNLSRSDKFEQSFKLAGFTQIRNGLGKYAENCFFKLIEQTHNELRSTGINHPEVDIRVIWETVCRLASENGYIDDTYFEINILQLAVEYETKINPVWPMTDLSVFFSKLNEKSAVLGIVSNAQFYTPLLFPALTGKSFKGFGISPSLCIWSYEHSAAKPSIRLFDSLLMNLKTKFSIRPSEVLYIGNDMLNDIYTAKKAGCSTCLFAGDRRSLRTRDDHPGCNNTTPDAIVISLDQVLKLI